MDRLFWYLSKRSLLSWPAGITMSVLLLLWWSFWLSSLSFASFFCRIVCSFHTSNAFHTACRVRLGGEGDGNGDWPPLFWAPPSVFAHFEFYFSKLSITMNSISHPNSMDFPPLVVVVKRGDLTKWDIEQVFGTITCLLNTPTPNLPHPPPNTEISFHRHHRASLLDQHLILAHLPYLPSRP